MPTNIAALLEMTSTYTYTTDGNGLSYLPYDVYNCVSSPTDNFCIDAGLLDYDQPVVQRTPIDNWVITNINPNSYNNGINFSVLTYPYLHDYGEPGFIRKRNERERMRVRNVNEGYARLRDHLPLEPNEKRLSKVETLRGAINYIKLLQDILEKSSKVDKKTNLYEKKLNEETNDIDVEN
ncbi:achaete-scute complex protein T3 isoform X1 [Hydra vulgaris]|uniref:Achaete-scute homolog 5 n=1 Tax=Hydra vulgaris TaxID=6087 RepID=T2MBC7_HYDVU|nr:achaete-scute complex protein T3-like [Hydra vulgaris]